MKSISIYTALLTAALTSSCAVYESSPIDLKTEETAWRQTTDKHARLTLTPDKARQVGLLLSPDLNKARLKLAAPAAVEKEAGWWNDPGVSWEVAKAIHTDFINNGGGLRFSIPVTGLPALEKQVAAQYREVDYRNLQQRELDFLSNLEQAWNKLAVTRKRMELTRARLAVMKIENEMIRKLVLTGEAEFTAQQVADQRYNNAARELQTQAEEELEQKMELIRLMGVHPAAVDKIRFLTGAGFAIPAAVKAPTTTELIDSPMIQEQLATYATTETVLKTEIRKQYPELELGANFKREGDGQEVGGGIGFNIPLWNRNRKAIAEARGGRDVCRAETLQVWKERLTAVRSLADMQKLMRNHCREELSRMSTFEKSVNTVEKMYNIGETTMQELAEARHQLFESRMAFLNRLIKLMNTQSQLRYITTAGANLKR